MRIRDGPRYRKYHTHMRNANKKIRPSIRRHAESDIDSGRCLFCLVQFFIAKNIALCDEQLGVLIEAAAKQIKIEENSGIIFDEAVEVPESTE